eukprot:TRINITY_DN95847_c0_g1_i1.p1 TRINITY_DN95847_c0_g1~~TRINITY_DN95847_c0_g1_i1.p1  ORF type:complete len:167 (-),score=41.58 TRINITY_DN95847_c0_g1_i1:19-519(-)
MASEQLQQAKAVVRDFVLEMRGGKRMMVLAPSGQLKTTVCSLSKRLDVFRIRKGDQVKRIPLVGIRGIHAGTEPEGLSTPLDDLCATIVISPASQLITFRFEHINARDTFVMCMLLFAQSLGAEMGGAEEEGEYEEEVGEDDEEDDGSEAGEGDGDQFMSGVASDL